MLNLFENIFGGPGESGSITGLLVARRPEKHGFGYGEVDGETLKDVPRTTINF